MKTCDDCGQPMDEGFIVEIFDPEHPNEPDLAEVCLKCYQDMVGTDSGEDDDLEWIDTHDDGSVYGPGGRRSWPGFENVPW